jgi:hypothetical protein
VGQIAHVSETILYFLNSLDNSKWNVSEWLFWVLKVSPDRNWNTRPRSGHLFSGAGFRFLVLPLSSYETWSHEEDRPPSKVWISFKWNNLVNTPSEVPLALAFPCLISYLPLLSWLWNRFLFLQILLAFGINSLIHQWRMSKFSGAM